MPRYTLRKPLSTGWGYFFNVPTWARKAGCPIANEPLGTDYAAARDRAENVLLPAFDAWLNGGATEAIAANAPAKPGTLDWLIAEYRASRQFTKLDPMTRVKHEVGFRLVGGYVLKNGARLGAARLNAIDAGVVDGLFDKLLIVTATDAAGNVIERERRTTVNHAMKSCRRAWNVATRRSPGKVPAVNPFAQMGLESNESETPTATFAELQAFRTKAIEMGRPSLATAASIAWEWLQREADIFATFDAAHYRPKHQRADAAAGLGNAEAVAHLSARGRHRSTPHALDREGRSFVPPGCAPNSELENLLMKARQDTARFCCGI
jgi:hypothetical protein